MIEDRRLRPSVDRILRHNDSALRRLELEIWNARILRLCFPWV